MRTMHLIAITTATKYERAQTNLLLKVIHVNEENENNGVIAFAIWILYTNRVQVIDLMVVMMVFRIMIIFVIVRAQFEEMR